MRHVCFLQQVPLSACVELVSIISSSFPSCMCVACFLSALSGGGLRVINGASTMSSSRLLAPSCVAYSSGMGFHGCYGGCDMKVFHPSIFVFARDCRT